MKQPQRIRLTEAAAMLGYKCPKSVLRLGIETFKANPNKRNSPLLVNRAEVEAFKAKQRGY